MNQPINLPHPFLSLSGTSAYIFFCNFGTRIHPIPSIFIFSHKTFFYPNLQLNSNEGKDALPCMRIKFTTGHHLLYRSMRNQTRVTISFCFRVAFSKTTTQKYRPCEKCLHKFTIIDQFLIPHFSQRFWVLIRSAMRYQTDVKRVNYLMNVLIQYSQAKRSIIGGVEILWMTTNCI